MGAISTSGAFSYYWERWHRIDDFDDLHTKLMVWWLVLSLEGRYVGERCRVEISSTLWWRSSIPRFNLTSAQSAGAVPFIWKLHLYLHGTFGTWFNIYERLGGIIWNNSYCNLQIFVILKPEKEIPIISNHPDILYINTG